MTATNFERALSAVLKHEGGWADHPADPGGATMKGVTLATYRRYRPGATKADLRKITDAELARIYRDGYWDEVRGDDLPSGVDYATFDFGVNSGPSRSIKMLQAVLGVKADGVIGPITLDAVRNADPGGIITDLCDRRLNWLKTLGTFKTFGKGWTSRVRGVKKLALEMTVAFQTPPDLRQPDDPGPAPEKPVQPVPPPPDIPTPATPKKPATGAPKRSIGGALMSLLFIICAGIGQAWNYLKGK